MAVVNSQTLGQAKYTLFYRMNQHKVPVPLPFMIMTIDEDAQFWVPRCLTGEFSGTWDRLQGSADSVVYVDHNAPFPVGSAALGSWAYYGV